jgi:hypothetical protein
MTLASTGIIHSERRARTGPALGAVVVENKCHVIVNGDDFGYSRGVNRGFIEAFDHGIVTSASLTIDQPGAEDVRSLTAGSSKA